MIDQDKYLKALKFAGEAHIGQFVPGSEMSYVVHIASVAMEIIAIAECSSGFDADLAVQCALLHDTIEDTNISYEDVLNSFGKPVADGVLALTKNENLPKQDRMIDSLKRIKKQPPEVAAVKLADRITNMQHPPHFWSDQKKKIYHAEAQLILEQLSGANEHLEERLIQKIENYRKFI